jgi:hypothetical protein
LNLIVFRGEGYQKTWYLLVPAAILLSEKEIAELYTLRMSIKEGF